MQWDLRADDKFKSYEKNCGLSTRFCELFHYEHHASTGPKAVRFDFLRRQATVGEAHTKSSPYDS